MVKTLNLDFIPFQDDAFNIEPWLEQIGYDDELIRSACQISQIAGKNKQTQLDYNCFLQSIEMAEIVAHLQLGETAVACALLYPPIVEDELKQSDLQETLGTDVAQLIDNTLRLKDIHSIQQADQGQHIANIRKMLLAMVRDVRVVALKLAERLSTMRHAATLDEYTQKQLAHETLDIYAPLASRLGISDIKWQLEDHAFALIDADNYKRIAKHLQHKRREREQRVQSIIARLNQALQESNIQGEVAGRAKHLYSIYNKMRRKNIDVDGIFDAIAVRVLVPEINDCYTILGLVHELWQPIPEEFDDYIANPKPNGYQSIHTAVKDADNYYFEIQIRTYAMHQESEMGMAAHWAYKEGSTAQGGSFEQKIQWLRQLLEWQKDITADQQAPQELEKGILEDRVYVFTPEGDIKDLPQGATPLDFAYTIHTDVGHRCRGAKVNNQMVPLTRALQTGDTVSIITGKESKPSRDWLLPQHGYLQTSQAYSKVLSWFKRQEKDQQLQTGRQLLDKELKKLNLETPSYDKMAQNLKFKSSEAMLVALGQGRLTIQQILQVIKPEQSQPSSETDELKLTETKKPASSHSQQDDVQIQGAGGLLTYIAKCCKPVPPEPIVGYITQGYGVSIHRQDCHNIQQIDEQHQNRLIEVDWLGQTRSKYPVNLNIQAYDRSGLVSDVAQVLTQNKLSIRQFSTDTDNKTQQASIILTIDIDSLQSLSRIMEAIRQIPNVTKVERHRS